MKQRGALGLLALLGIAVLAKESIARSVVPLESYLATPYGDNWAGINDAAYTARELGYLGRPSLIIRHNTARSMGSPDKRTRDLFWFHPDGHLSSQMSIDDERDVVFKLSHYKYDGGIKSIDHEFPLARRKKDFEFRRDEKGYLIGLDVYENRSIKSVVKIEYYSDGKIKGASHRTAEGRVVWRSSYIYEGETVSIERLYDELIGLGKEVTFFIMNKDGTVKSAKSQRQPEDVFKRDGTYSYIYAADGSYVIHAEVTYFGGSAGEAPKCVFDRGFFKSGQENPVSSRNISSLPGICGDQGFFSDREIKLDSVGNVIFQRYGKSTLGNDGKSVLWGGESRSDIFYY